MEPAVTIMATVFFAFMEAVFTMYLLPVIIALLYTATSEKTEERTLISKMPSKPVAVLIPLYRERRESIVTTLRSIIRQRYDPSLITVYLIVEKGDELTKKGLEDSKFLLKEKGINYKVVESASSRRFGKSEALNSALRQVVEEVVIVFDADDEIPEDYLTLVATKISSGYDAATTKVYRYGEKLHAKLIFLDTMFWYDILLKFFKRLGQHIPLSGEGLALSISALAEVGGFPRSLTEDALLTLLLSIKKRRIAYLDNVFIKNEESFELFLDEVRYYISEHTVKILKKRKLISQTIFFSTLLIGIIMFLIFGFE
jgi:cellulose synthase/poly-beta-1,6-N-acetylglucosamine synthase-like glycosyltransferase